ncbi:MAG: hypothetical protein ACREMY_23445 [bacterium]
MTTLLSGLLITVLGAAIVGSLTLTSKFVRKRWRRHDPIEVVVEPVVVDRWTLVFPGAPPGLRRP